MKRMIVLIIGALLIISVAFTSSAIVLPVNEALVSSNIDAVKDKVAQYINMSMNKYDHTGTKKVCYDGIIKDKDFYSYAQKMAQLENNRYKAFPELKIEELAFDIVYNCITAEDNVYTVEAEVYETKKYKAFEEPGYVCTKHVITVENINGELYIADDVTNTPLDNALGCEAKENRISALERITEMDKKEIG